MKKIAALLICITLYFTLCSCDKVSSPVEDFTFEFSDNTVTVTGYTGTDLEVVVPEIIEDRPVTKIGKNVFSECDIKSVTLPQSVTLIDDEAFYKCTSLEQITLSDNITELGVRCFSECQKLKIDSLPNNLVTISDFCFSSCESIETIVIPENVTFIGTNAFIECKNLESVTMTNELFENLKSEFINHPTIQGDVNYGIFSDCPNLKVNNIPINELDN